MKLFTILAKHRSAILKQWVDSIVETYPAETAQFLRSKKDLYHNPVGHTIKAETENIFRQLLAGMDREKMTPFLDRIIRIRAIQDFTPSQALYFVFALKYIIRQEVAAEIDSEALEQELVDLEASIDMMALLAFEVYMACREKIYELKAKEVQQNAYLLLRRAELIVERPGRSRKDNNANQQG